MWNSKRFIKLFDHPLLALLRLYLAPQREQKKRNCIQQTKQANTKQEARLPATVSESVQGNDAEKIAAVHLSRNSKEKLVRQKRKKHDQYTNKAELHQDPSMKRKYQQWADRSLQKSDLYINVLKAERQEVSEMGENEAEQSDDAMTELEIQAEDNNIAAAVELDNADDEGEDNMGNTTKE